MRDFRFSVEAICLVLNPRMEFIIVLCVGSIQGRLSDESCFCTYSTQECQKASVLAKPLSIIGKGLLRLSMPNRSLPVGSPNRWAGPLLNCSSQRRPVRVKHDAYMHHGENKGKQKT